MINNHVLAYKEDKFLTLGRTFVFVYPSVLKKNSLPFKDFDPSSPQCP